MRVVTNYRLKSDWQRPSACNITRLDFLRSKNIDISSSYIVWPESFLEIEDFAFLLGMKSGFVDLNRLINKGSIYFSTSDSIGDIKKKVNRVILFYNKSMEPIYLCRPWETGKCYELCTRNETKLLEKEELVIFLSINKNLFSMNPAFTWNSEL